MTSKVTLVCTKCGLEKLTENFSKNKTKKIGFNSDCKACRKTYDKIRYQSNKEKRASYDKIWKINNPHKRRAQNSRRRATKVQAVPTWTSQFQKLQIQSIHDEARNRERSTGIKFHVDHIHALNPPKIHYFEGEWIGEICGLELPCNLQLLTESENCSKSNKFECYVVSDLDTSNLKSWEVL